jgi:flagellar motor switch protein FliN/FliY
MSEEGQAVQEQLDEQIDPSQSGNAEVDNEDAVSDPAASQASADQKEPTGAKTQAQSVEFSEAVETEVSGPGGSIDILLDMKVPVTVTVGHTEIPVQRFLRLGHGSVLKLDKSVEEPVELYLRDTKFATGSVVVVDGRFAVKIKQILSPATPK